MAETTAGGAPKKRKSPATQKPAAKKSATAAKPRKPAAKQGWSYHRVGSMWTLFFQEQTPNDFASVKAGDLDRFAHFFRSALKNGIYLPASQFEAVFLSAAMTDEETTQLIEGLHKSL